MERSPETEAIHGGAEIDPLTGAIVPPIHLSVTFARDADYELLGPYVYGRTDTPTYAPLERLAARLDGGADALVFASGMAAITAVFETVSVGAHVVAPQVMYHGAQQWLRRLAGMQRIGLTLFDQTDPGALAASIRPGETNLVWIETPVNPTWDIIDIRAAADAAGAAGATLAVDATATPVTTRPIELGADLVFHAATKYYNGHSDVSGGILVTAAEDDRWREVEYVRGSAGGVIGPVEAWLLLRGMRTLHLRVERSSENALAIARHLEGHPALSAVLYPGLESHPGHDVARRQMDRGFGGMLSIRVAGGAAAARRVATATRVFVPATSLGGVESLIEHRAVVEPPDSVVPDDLLRLSVGIEPIGELIADLDQALERA